MLVVLDKDKDSVLEWKTKKYSFFIPKYRKLFWFYIFYLYFCKLKGEITI